ncbi:phosphoglycerate mutase [Desulfurella acetivorans A63]|nr:phosphoglycerate mutase [Desulfurella acetivorans A63]
MYLLRHAEPVNNNSGKYIGQIDLPLSEKGEMQAQEWRNFFKRQYLTRIITSDLTRSKQTVYNIFSEKHNIEENPAFREISLGDWEGLPMDYVRQKLTNEYNQRGADLANYSPPNGESFRDLQNRVMKEFQNVISKALKNDKILIVTHIGVIRVILASIFEMPLQKIFTISVDYSGMVLLESNSRGHVVRGINLNPCSLKQNNIKI